MQGWTKQRCNGFLLLFSFSLRTKWKVSWKRMNKKETKASGPTYLIKIRLCRAHKQVIFCQPLLKSYPVTLVGLSHSVSHLSRHNWSYEKASALKYSHTGFSGKIFHGKILIPGMLIPFTTQNFSVVSRGVSGELELIQRAFQVNSNKQGKSDYYYYSHHQDAFQSQKIKTISGCAYNLWGWGASPGAHWELTICRWPLIWRLK